MSFLSMPNSVALRDEFHARVDNGPARPHLTEFGELCPDLDRCCPNSAGSLPDFLDVGRARSKSALVGQMLDRELGQTWATNLGRLRRVPSGDFRARLGPSI